MSIIFRKIKNPPLLPFWKKMLFILLLIFSFFMENTNGQSTTSPDHALILEAAGIGSYGSLSYEKNLMKKNNIRFNASIGLSTLGIIDFDGKFNPDVIIPIKGMILLNWKKHHLVLGIGQVFSSFPRVERPALDTQRKNTISGSTLLGYRWQNRAKRFFVQATYSPVWQQYKRFRHWGGLSFGFSLIKRKKNVN